VNNENTSKYEIPEIIRKMAENPAEKIDRTKIQSEISKEIEKSVAENPGRIPGVFTGLGSPWESCRGFPGARDAEFSFHRGGMICRSGD